jgi:hypothetical protein
VDEVNGHRLISHGGGIPGFSTNIMRFVDDHITVIVLCNSDWTNAGSLAAGIARHYIPTLAPAAPKTVAVSPKTVSSIAGYYDRNGRISPLLIQAGRLTLNDTPLSFSAPDAFFLNDFEVSPQIQKFRVVKDSAGEVREIVQNEQEHALRIGPLASTIAPQPDPDTAQTGRREALLKALAQGEKDLNSFPLAPGFKEYFAGKPLPELAGGVSEVSFLASLPMADRAITRFGSKVDRVAYYKLRIGGASKYILLYLTQEGNVTDEDVVTG